MAFRRAGPDELVSDLPPENIFNAVELLDEKERRRLVLCLPRRDGGQYDVALLNRMSTAEVIFMWARENPAQATVEAFGLVVWQVLQTNKK